MRFRAVPPAGVLFCVWETRVQDFGAFIEVTGHDLHAHHVRRAGEDQLDRVEDAGDVADLLEIEPVGMHLPLHLLPQFGAGKLAPGGRLFIHVFAHRRFAYPFEVDGDRDWMARHFFTGGLMPSHDLLDRIPGPLEVEESWLVPGTHYAKTAEAWIERLAAHRAEALAVLRRDLPAGEAKWRAGCRTCRRRR